MSEFGVPWRRLIDSAPDGMCILDEQTAILYANAAALSLLGLPPPGGASMADWLEGLGEQNRDLLLRAITENGQVRLHLAGAKHPHLVFEAAPLPGGEGTVSRIRRDYEAEASEIVAILTHDLRKPMTSIVGYGKMLLSMGAGSLSDTQRHFLETINRNVNRLNRNLSAVQDMTRIDRGRIKLALGPQSLAKAAVLALHELRALAEERNHQVTLDIPDDLPHVRADAERLAQVLHILLDNALKYTPPGGHIQLRAQPTDGRVQIDVKDDGIGIPEVEQVKLFSKFFRGEAEIVNEHAGLGLNLYIARGLVQLQGGELRLESTPSKGSTFSFSLPTGGED